MIIPPAYGERARIAKIHFQGNPFKAQTTDLPSTPGPEVVSILSASALQKIARPH